MGFWQNLTDEDKQMSIIVGLIIAGIITLIYLVSYRTEQNAYIDAMTWERHIVVEEYKTVIEEGWHVPIGGRELDRWSEQRGTESYICDEEWNETTQTYDDVYCERPVYDTRYRYEIDKWVYDYTLRSKGNDRDPYWPTVTDVNYTRRQLELGDERLGPYTEYYYLHFIIDDKPLVYTTHDINEWLGYEIEYQVTITRNLLGGIVTVRKNND